MNLPNKITICRIILIPIIIFFYLAESFLYGGKLVASILFLIGILTDYLDGHLARKNGQVTVLGTFLDTIADKMFVTTALLLVITDGTVAQPYGAIIAVVIILREFMVSALRQLAASKNKIISADYFGKFKAVLQFFSLFFFMLYSFFMTRGIFADLALSVIYYVCFGLLAITAIITLISGVHYIVKNKEVFIETETNKTVTNCIETNKAKTNSIETNKAETNKE